VFRLFLIKKFAGIFSCTVVKTDDIYDIRIRRAYNLHTIQNVSTFFSNYTSYRLMYGVIPDLSSKNSKLLIPHYILVSPDKNHYLSFSYNPSMKKRASICFKGINPIRDRFAPLFYQVPLPKD